MSVPLYLNEIDSASTSVAHESAEEKITRLWNELESKVGEFDYDILSSAIGTSTRDLIRELISVLYSVSPGSPSSDCAQIRKKDMEYGGSWHKRGGTGAFHALARKGDRFLSQMKKFNTIERCRNETSAEAIDDTLGDMRRYLILIEAWHRCSDPQKKDSGKSSMIW